MYAWQPGWGGSLSTVQRLEQVEVETVLLHVLQFTLLGVLFGVRHFDFVS